jgi:hypothetical protein
MTDLRTVRRPRRYVPPHWLTLLRPLFGYDRERRAYLLRGVGQYFGPVLRPDRRVSMEQPEGVDRRRRPSAA